MIKTKTKIVFEKNIISNGKKLYRSIIIDYNPKKPKLFNIREV